MAKLRHDVNETAVRLVQAATGNGEPPHPPGQGTPNPVAVKRGRAGGKKGGKVRAGRLSPAKRSEIAKKAARARWDSK